MERYLTMRNLFLVFLLLSAPAFAGECDAALMQCLTYAPNRQAECYAFHAQCRQQEMANEQLRQMNAQQRLMDDDSLMASRERVAERYRRR